MRYNDWKMGLTERANNFMLRNYRILILIVILVVFLMSILLPAWTFIQEKRDLTKEVNPTIINGILTATAIVFGFVAFELRDIKSGIIEKFLLSSPLLLFLMITLEWYFIQAIVGNITAILALEATANCLFNILYFMPVTMVKLVREEIEHKKEFKQQQLPPPPSSNP
jgi:magnesium-transporting ATPase (P-type)